VPAQHHDVALVCGAGSSSRCRPLAISKARPPRNRTRFPSGAPVPFDRELARLCGAAGRASAAHRHCHRHAPHNAPLDISPGEPDARRTDRPLGDRAQYAHPHDRGDPPGCADQYRPVAARNEPRLRVRSLPSGPRVRPHLPLRAPAFQAAACAKRRTHRPAHCLNKSLTATTCPATKPRCTTPDRWRGRPTAAEQAQRCGWRGLRGEDRLRRRHCITFSLVNARVGRLSVDLGPLKADLYEAAHRAGVSPSVLARKAIAALLSPTTDESRVEVSRPAPRAVVERVKPEGKVRFSTPNRLRASAAGTRARRAL